MWFEVGQTWEDREGQTWSVISVGDEDHTTHPVVALNWSRCMVRTYTTSGGYFADWDDPRNLVTLVCAEGENLPTYH